MTVPGGTSIAFDVLQGEITMGQPDETEIARIPVRTRRTLRIDGSARHERFVYCSVRGGSVAIALCAGCPRLAGTYLSATDAGLECTAFVPRAPKARADVAEVAARTRVGEVVARETVCVDSAAPLEAVAALLENGAVCVPVVGSDGKLVGLASTEQVLRLEREDDACLRTAGDAMTAPMYVLLETSPLSIALALLAAARERALPVVAETGAVVGVLSGADVVGWLARTVGYEPNCESGWRAP
jgi:CBS domain-containing protein